MLEIVTNDHYKNLQTLAATMFIIFFVTVIFIFGFEVSLFNLIGVMIIMVIIFIGLYAFFENYDKKIGKKVYIFEDEELIKARRMAPDKLRYIIKPVRYEQIRRIEIRSRYFKFYYKRNGKEHWSMLPLKAVFMDEDEQRRRERILEELLKRVKKSNPDVEIIDKRREKKVK